MLDRALLVKEGPIIGISKALLLAGLVLYLLVKGLIPACISISEDFPEYFTSAKSVRDGVEAEKLYDGGWFREQTRRYHVGSQENPGEFTPYPPPTALLLVPLAGFEPITALRIVTALNVACLISSALLLKKIFAWRLADSGLFILSSGWALQTGLRFGHPYILISTACLLGYYLYRRHRPFAAGVCLGAFVPIKYYPLVVLVGFACQRQWRVFLGGGTTIAVVTLVSVAVLGWKVHEIFLVDVLANHLTGHLVPGPRFTAVFQSFDTLFERLFIFDPVRNPHPWIAVPEASTPAIIITKVGLGLVAVASVAQLVYLRNVRAVGPTIGVLGLLVFLLAPGSGTYAVVLLWLPVALLIDYFLFEHARASAYLILAVYVLIGFIPYGHTYRFEGHGVLSVLAFPRLLLLLAMFGVCTYALWFPTRSVKGSREPTLNTPMNI